MSEKQSRISSSDRAITTDLLKQLGHFTRDFAKAYPARYQVMMQVQLSPSDLKAGTVIRELLGFLHRALSAYDLSETQLIDVMRMFNSATYGFIALEQKGLMTLERPDDCIDQVFPESRSPLYPKGG